MPRIIAGKFRGRALAAPKGTATRPTQDRVKEALFSILGGALEPITVIDLFAGTGSLGLEALSRGARHVTFVESDEKALAALAANIDKLGAAGAVTVIAAPVPRALARLAAADLILLDPPYALDALDAVLAKVFGLLAPGGTCVVEAAAKRALQIPPGAQLTTERVYGDTKLAFFRAPADAGGAKEPDA